MRNGAEFWRTSDVEWSDRVLVDGQHIYLLAYHEVYALDAAAGVRTWHYLSGGPRLSDRELIKDGIYLVGDDGKLRVLDTMTGLERLAQDIGAAWPSPMLASDGKSVYVTTNVPEEIDVVISAVDLETGDVRWSSPS